MTSFLFKIDSEPPRSDFNTIYHGLGHFHKPNKFFSELQLKDISGNSGHPRLGQAEINPLRVTRIHHPRELPECVITERH